MKRTSNLTFLQAQRGRSCFVFFSTGRNTDALLKNVLSWRIAKLVLHVFVNLSKCALHQFVKFWLRLTLFCLVCARVGYIFCSLWFGYAALFAPWCFRPSLLMARSDVCSWCGEWWWWNWVQFETSWNLCLQCVGFERTQAWRVVWALEPQHQACIWMLQRRWHKRMNTDDPPRFFEDQTTFFRCGRPLFELRRCVIICLIVGTLATEPLVKHNKKFPH